MDIDFSCDFCLKVNCLDAGYHDLSDVLENKNIDILTKLNTELNSNTEFSNSKFLNKYNIIENKKISNNNNLLSSVSQHLKNK
jgi:uncharacterized SAM-dependent methyltransferase